MKDDLMKWTLLGMIIASISVGGIIGYVAGSDAVTQTRDSRDYRRLELQVADMAARLATLERIGVEIDLNDRTGTWFVLNGRVQ